MGSHKTYGQAAANHPSAEWGQLWDVLLETLKIQHEAHMPSSTNDCCQHPELGESEESLYPQINASVSRKSCFPTGVHKPPDQKQEGKH